MQTRTDPVRLRGESEPAGGMRGRALMSAHHASARVWMTAALLAMLLPPARRLGWWLPLHLALAGAVSQLIVGGQVMFSATLGLAKGPARRTVIAQLALMNIGVAGVAAGRVFSSKPILAVGASSFLVALLSAAIVVHRLWRRSLNRRFAITGTFYRLAMASVVMGSGTGWAVASGVFHSADAYAWHKFAHMALNLFGWAGLTIAGTIVTLLPTVLHVRIPEIRRLRIVPWTMFAGICVMAVGLTVGARAVATGGAVVLVVGVAPLGGLVRGALSMPRRRRIPLSACHLIAAMAWCAFVCVIQVVVIARGDGAALRDLWVVGLAAGFTLQAVIGAWSFLLPSARRVDAETRRRELVAFEVGAMIQVVAYNVGLVLVLASLRGLLPATAGTAGAALVCGAAAFAVAKSWAFALLARLPRVRARAQVWWMLPNEPANG